MPRLTAFSHPVHPILQAIPALLLPASTTFDVLARLGIDEEGLSKAAPYSLVFGLLGAVCAATTGLLDYYEIEKACPQDSSLSRPHERDPRWELRSALSAPQGPQGGRHSLGPLRVGSGAHRALRLPRGRVGLPARGAGGRRPRRHTRGILEEDTKRCERR